MSYSVRGVARRFLYTGGGLHVTSTFFPAGSTGPHSLRQRLRELATTEYSFEAEECKYGWKPAYQQRWSHLIMRIELQPFLVPIPAATMDALRATWKTGIESTWSHRWAVGRTGEVPCNFELEVQWVVTNPHQTVAVVTGSGETNSGVWYTVDSGAVAAHEVGHLLGHADEYLSADCPDRVPVATGTVMDKNSNVVPARLMQAFADHLQSNVVSAV